MFITRRGLVTWAAAAAGGVFMLTLAMTLGAPAADDKTYVMKIALATLDDALHQYAKNYAAAVEKDSGGRIKAEIYPASQLGSNGANGTAFKIGWALDYRKRVRDFNSTALPQLGGLRYKVELTEQWNTAREAYRMEQALLRKFDRHQHPSNREVLVNVEYDALWNAWRDACNRNNPAAGAAAMKR